MYINVLNGWTNFWNNVGNFFVELWNRFYEKWFNPPTVDGVTPTPYFGTFLIAIAFLIIGLILVKIILYLIRKALKLGKKRFEKNRTVTNFVFNLVKFLLYIGLVIIFLMILGVNLNGFAQIFSSAILAIGLSLQDVVGNFASGIIILSNKTFVAGDYISVDNGEAEGTVVDVGFLTTKLITTNQEIIYVPNKVVTNGVVVNFSANPTRRINIQFTLANSYDIEKAKQELLEIVSQDDRVLKEPVPYTVVSAINEYSYTISVRCFVNNEEYWDILFHFNEVIVKARNANKLLVPVQKIAVTSDTSTPLKPSKEKKDTKK